MYLGLRVFRGISSIGFHTNPKISIGGHPIPQLCPMTQPNDDPVFGDSRLDRVTWEVVLVNTAPRFAQLSRGHAPSLITRGRCQLNNGII